MSNIKYTFPSNFPVSALAGQTVVGGTIKRWPINGVQQDVVHFATLVDGRPVIAIIKGKPELEAIFAQHKAEQAAKDAAMLAAADAHAKTPEGQRERLVIAEYNLYSENNFPGSEKWHRWNDAVQALRAFDAAHPDLAKAAKDAYDAKSKADYEALSDFVKMGS